MNHSSRRWRRFAVTSLAVVAAGVLVLTGCSAQSPTTTHSSSDKPVKGGNLTIQISSDPGGLDQAAYPSIETVNISELIFEKLFALDAKNQPKPMLVDNYKLSPDRTTYTFNLRKDIKFSDGTPMTSADVVASLEYWLKNQQYGMTVAKSVVSIEAPTDLQVVVKLNAPRYPFISELTGVGTAILKKDIADKLTPKGFSNDQVIGTGPYKLKSWDVNQQIVVERNDLYKSLAKEDTGYAGAKHAYLDSITFKIVADTDAVKNGLLTGQWLYASPTPDAYPELKANPDLVTHTLTGGNLNLLIMNQAPSSIFNKTDARDGLSLVIDRKAIMAATGGSPDLTVENGALTPKAFATTYSTAGDSEYNAHDPKKGAEMLKAAGYSDAKPIQILTTNSFPAFYQWATLIQDQLSKVGIKADIHPYDFTTMLAQMQTEPDKWDFVPIFFNGAFPTPGQMNVFQNPGQAPDMQKALADYNNVTDTADAHKIMNTLTKLLWRDKPDVILGMTTPYASYSPKLKGYDNYWYVFWNSWIAK